MVIWLALAGVATGVAIGRSTAKKSASPRTLLKSAIRSTIAAKQDLDALIAEAKEELLDEEAVESYKHKRDKHDKQ
jgi:hypothetical protein